MAARTYSRDSRGRFASGGGGGGGGKGGAGKGKAKAPMGPLSARSSLRRSKEKLAANQTSAQKGAVTRASKKLAEAKKAARRTLPFGSNRPIGTMRGKVRRDPGALQRRNAQRAEKAQSKAAQRGKQMARTSKAPESAAKSRFKELSTKARRGNRYGGNFPDEARAGGAAKRSLAAMVKNRGVSGKSKSKGRKRG